jgi:hypothetical protein
MSLDNVIAIAAAAEAATAGIGTDHAATLKAILISFGLATSIPLIVAGSAVLMALLARYRVLIWAGGALLGWIAGDIMATDPALTVFIGSAESQWSVWAARAGALIVVAIGLFSVGRQQRLAREDVLAGIGIALWIAAGMGITNLIAPEAETLRWIARGLVAIVLAGGYLALRNGRPPGREQV